MRFQITELTRIHRNGKKEPPLIFKPGVNLLVAPPNAGKTTWLQMFNHLLGAEASPSQVFPDEVVETYEAVKATVLLDRQTVRLERRWHGHGNLGKVLWDGVPLHHVDFQKRLMKALGLPVLGYPRADTLTLPVWPSLSFRMLFRHLYRQQRFWTDIVAKQPDSEMRACLLLLMGLAPAIFTDGYRKYFQLSAERTELSQRIHAEQVGLQMIGHVLLEQADDESGGEQADRLCSIDILLSNNLAAREMLSNAAIGIDNARILGRLEYQHEILCRWRKLAQASAADLDQLTNIENETRPLFMDIERARELDQVSEAADELTAGMTEYLRLLNKYRPATWLHREPHVSFRRNSVVFDVGARRWNQALGGTDSLYFQLAYHYALLKVSTLPGYAVPGLAILDLPAEFAGESIAHLENFVVQPFIDLVGTQGQDAAQVIFAGASFDSLEGVERVPLMSRHLA